MEHAKEEGVIFDLLKNPKKIIKDENNHVIGMDVVDMILCDSDSERKNVIESDVITRVDCDMVVMALGTSPNKALLNSGIIFNDKGLIEVEESKTNLNNVYAGGDAVTGSATVILAMEAGIKAAKKIMEEV